MKLRSLARRPSASILISSAALFMSLGGVGYAAVSIPNNSVGSSQLKNNAVTYKKINPSSVGNVRLNNNAVSNSKLANNSISYNKIKPGSVGTVRADLDQIQARLKSCPAGQAVTSADSKGNVSCTSTLGGEYGTAATTVAVGAADTTVASKALPAGPSYLAFANPTALVTSGAAAQRVTFSCRLAVGTSSQTRSVVIPTSGNVGQTSGAAIPLQVGGPAGTSAVACSATLPGGGAPPKTVVTGAVNALAASSLN